MKFRIYFNDLSFEKQEELREELKTTWLENLYEEAKENRAKYPEYEKLTDDEILNDLYDFMDEETIKSWKEQGKYEEMLKFDVESFAEEKADDDINTEFYAEGEI